MKWMGVNELRDRFLKFYQSKEHYLQPSAPLVPIGDSSLLLINSGMAPLKDYFLGLKTPPSKRMVTCQKCIRTPDIEEVGKTDRHGTFFEMLGNFSFGDYFKVEATTWAWEFLTKELEIPEDRLWVTIYLEDDEAYDIWTQVHHINPDRIVRMGKEDNFWEIGSGPCGPCSEIYFDRGEEYTCDAEVCGIGHCDCDRYMEIWNLVFTQFNSDGKGNYTPLEHPNIDTGMGLERIACVMQGVGNLFEVDTIQNIMKRVSEIAGVPYKQDAKTDVSLRVVTDHIRSTVFLIGDGVLPSNEGRGYVLRRLLRRAARHGRLLGIRKPFLYDVCDEVIEANKDIYPNLMENADYIKKVVRIEEENFGKTIEQGMNVLDDLIDKIDVIRQKHPIIEGKEVFRLYDTFGFPIDLTREIAQDHGVAVDEEGFLAHMKEQRERARKAHAEQAGIGWEEDVLAEYDIQDTFHGYDVLETKTKILSMIVENQVVDTIGVDQKAMFVLEDTPFYAESGGQVGDKGLITQGDAVFVVEDCKKSPTGHYLHMGYVQAGHFSTGDMVIATVDEFRRKNIMRNHSATHLLQAALREVLGDHVHQAGSYVDDKVTRFDFTHFSAVTSEELAQIEGIVNRRIMESIPVSIEEMPMEEAKKRGATALFGDKYQDVVRVCTMGDASMELCGGTHVSNTAQVGLFKIISESSVAAGVRRIEATTGLGILALLEEETATIRTIGQIFKSNSAQEVVTKAKNLVAQVADLEGQVLSLETKIAAKETQDVGNNMTQIGPVKMIALAVVGKLEPLQVQADILKEQHPDVVGVFIAQEETKATALAFAGKDAVKAGINCGKLVKSVAGIAGGSGGGRPDNAKGGIPDVTKVDDALGATRGFIEAQLG